MSPEEKWKRLNNPSTIDDYAITMSLDELKTIPEAKEIVEGMKSANSICKESMQRFCAKTEQDMYEYITYNIACIKTNGE